MYILLNWPGTQKKHLRHWWHLRRDQLITNNGFMHSEYGIWYDPKFRNERVTRIYRITGLKDSLFAIFKFHQQHRKREKRTDPSEPENRLRSAAGRQDRWSCSRCPSRTSASGSSRGWSDLCSPLSLDDDRRRARLLAWCRPCTCTPRWIWWPHP